MRRASVSPQSPFPPPMVANHSIHPLDQPLQYEPYSLYLRMQLYNLIDVIKSNSYYT